jgi:hypothetical protein
VMFDLAPEAISGAQLDALYANEQLPTLPSLVARAQASVQISRC